MWYLEFFSTAWARKRWGICLLTRDAAHGLAHYLSTLWGFALTEWRGSSHWTMTLVLLGLLVVSTIIVG
jgi:L-rhamnose-H+ transport protein